MAVKLRLYKRKSWQFCSFLSLRACPWRLHSRYVKSFTTVIQQWSARMTPHGITYIVAIAKSVLLIFGELRTPGKIPLV